jgi:hypothetical protein
MVGESSGYDRRLERGRLFKQVAEAWESLVYLENNVDIGIFKLFIIEVLKTKVLYSFKKWEERD